MFFSGLLMFASFILLFVSGWALPWSIGVITTALLALLFYTDKINFSPAVNHSMWHILSAIVCIFCLLSVI